MDYEAVKLLPKCVYEDVEMIAKANIDWSRLQNKTVLITGAAGFIGYDLTIGLLTRNDLFGDNITVLALVRNREKAEKKFADFLKRDDLKLIISDVCTPFFISEKADFVIHAASGASADQFENDPVGVIDANLAGTFNALTYAHEAASEATLFVSSLKVYGALHNGKKIIDEDDIGYIDHVLYKNCYAVGKRAAETICASFHKQYGLSVKIARPAYIYGPSRLDDDRVWAQFIANIVRNQSILLKSNGAALRSFCYVSDTCVALLKILLDGEDMLPYNISDENSNITIRGFAKAATDAFPERNLTLSFANKADEIEPEPSPMAATLEVLSCARINNLGWKAEIDIHEGIKRSVTIAETVFKE
ncbi:MAG: NAD-dependent epimerase/dehydratase family protein [Bacillota bacterium]|nr:NAD-dependent epimerase/dehydratase family protein [Bacillota bacterium]